MESVANFLSVISDSTKLKIINYLLNGEKCVCEIVPYTNTKQSNVSLQLKKLVDAGILGSRREGKKIMYRIVDYRVCEIFKLMQVSPNKVNKEACCKNC